MGAKTTIEWTEATWNPLRGCSRVSAGCEHCYAEQVARRFSGPGEPYEGLVRLGKDGKPKAQWNGVVRLVSEHLGDPLRWTKPRRVFVNSMSDLFHESVAFEVIAAIFGVMAAAPRHTFQVLTKRPQRAAEFFEWYEGTSGAGASPYAAVCTARQYLADAGMEHVRDALSGAGEEWPLPHVWLGVSVEDQQSADERIPHLLRCSAAVRGVSYEPAIGPLCLDGLDGGDDWLGDPRDGTDREPGIDWVVVGGESGPGARPFDIAWARSVVEQCRRAVVPVFVKQLGAHPYTHQAQVDAHSDPNGLDFDEVVPVRLRDRKGGDMAEWPADLRVREWPRAEDA